MPGQARPLGEPVSPGKRGTFPGKSRRSRPATCLARAARRCRLGTSRPTVLSPFFLAPALADRARAAGVPVTLRLVEDSVHAFMLFDFLPESELALREFGFFAERQLEPG